MISDFTQQQLAEVTIDEKKPLIICDVDEVVVHFTRELEEFLGLRSLWLEPDSLALSGNIKSKIDQTAVKQEVLNSLIEEFFAERTKSLPPIDGAVEGLLSLGESANVVMLTNLPHFAKNDRIANLSALGLSYPVITNSGPKGPAIRNLASRTPHPIVFIDDSPGFIQSAYDHAPNVHLVHFLQDARFAVHIPYFEFVSLRTDTWSAVKPHVMDLLQT